MQGNKLTTASGCPVDNDLNSVTAGEGMAAYTMLQDQHLVEKLAHFNRERIPERVVHAKGAGAFGVFELKKDMSKYTQAKVFNGVGKKTEIFLRFSTVGGERGSSDSARDPRGFACKFYTEEGNYDIVGNNTPVFFIRDAIKFPDFVHTQKRNPQTNLPDPVMFWDFLSLTPESIHQVMILFSDRGTPKNYRQMDGFSSHTFLWYNSKKEYCWVKYHFKAVGGWATMTAAEAEALSGSNPNAATEDLFNAIESKKYPQWRLCVQIMTNEQAKTFKYDPFDVTKVWSQKQYPLIEIGTVTLNRNPANYFAEVEQAAFSPANFVPGIGPSPDKLLQGRLFAYHDAHRWRLGSNNQQIPVNAPKCPFAHNQRDGMMAVNGNGGPAPNYWPNTQTNVNPDPVFAPPRIELQAVIERHAVPVEDLDFEQPRELYNRVLKPEDKEHLIANLIDHLGQAPKPLQLRETALFYKVDPGFGTRVANGLKLDKAKVKALSEMTQADRVKNTPLQ